MRIAQIIGLLVLGLASLAWSQTSAYKSAGGGSQPSATPQQQQVTPLQLRNARYELRPGDILDVGFTFSPEFDQSLTVQPDGFVTLRAAGDLQVAGMTVPQVRTAIAKAYSTVLRDPQVNVVLKDFEKPYFIASGQINRPGKYELRGPMRVTEAIAVAGGFTDAAKQSQVVVYRRISHDWMEGTVVDVKKMLAHKDLNEDLMLRPDDFLYVPQSRYSHLRRFIPAPGVGMTVNPRPSLP